MMEEIKPCPFCGDSPSSKFTDMNAEIWCEPCDFKMEYSAMVSLRVAEDWHRKVVTERWNKRS